MSVSSPPPRISFRIVVTIKRLDTRFPLLSVQVLVIKRRIKKIKLVLDPPDGSSQPGVWLFTLLLQIVWNYRIMELLSFTA